MKDDGGKRTDVRLPSRCGRKPALRNRWELTRDAALREEKFQDLGVFAKGAAEAADKIWCERLEHKTLPLFDEGHLGPSFDGVLAAKLGGNDQPALSGDGGEFGLRGSSRGKIPSKYTGMNNVRQLI